jgi:hypothetical protein
MMRKKNDLPLTVEEISRAKSYAAQGYSCRAIGRELKRSDHTIAKLLARPDVADEVVVQKRELIELYEELNRKVLESVTEKDIQSASLLQKATTSGIFTDKMRLLRDESTSNINVQVLLEVAELIRRRDQPWKYQNLPAPPETCP